VRVPDLTSSAAANPNLLLGDFLETDANPDEPLRRTTATGDTSWFTDNAGLFFGDVLGTDVCRTTATGGTSEQPASCIIQ